MRWLTITLALLCAARSARADTCSGQPDTAKIAYLDHNSAIRAINDSGVMAADHGNILRITGGVEQGLDFPAGFTGICKAAGIDNQGDIVGNCGNTCAPGAEN